MRGFGQCTKAKKCHEFMINNLYCLFQYNIGNIIGEERLSELRNLSLYNIILYLTMLSTVKTELLKSKRNYSDIEKLLLFYSLQNMQNCI